MNDTWPRCIATCVFASVAQLLTPMALAQTAHSTAEVETRVRELEKTQQRLLEQMRKNRTTADAIPADDDKERARRDEEIQKTAREIEKRIASEAEGKLFFTASTPATAEMRAYYERLVARLEDCGTRYSPKRAGKSIYGKGVVSIGLDHGGNAVTMRIERSSNDELIDNHMLKLIGASAPFGPTPERIRLKDKRRYERLVVITSFEFTRDAEPAKQVKTSEQCKL